MTKDTKEDTKEVEAKEKGTKEKVEDAAEKTGEAIGKGHESLRLVLGFFPAVFKICSKYAYKVVVVSP